MRGAWSKPFQSEIDLPRQLFHNEFGRQIEYVGLDLVPALLPNLTAAEQHALEEVLVSSGAYELTLNTQAYRALGVETTVEGGIGRNIFLRGGYTYLDAVIQRSFANDDVALLGRFRLTTAFPTGFRLARIRRWRERGPSGARRTRASSRRVTRRSNSRPCSAQPL